MRGVRFGDDRVARGKPHSHRPPVTSRTTFDRMIVTYRIGCQPVGFPIHSEFLTGSEYRTNRPVTFHKTDRTFCTRIQLREIHVNPDQLCVIPTVFTGAHAHR